MTLVTTKRAVAIPDGNALQQVDTSALAKAFIAALPGGDRLTTDQATGLALASQVSNRNPFTREMYMIPGVGATDAAKSSLSDFNEWLNDHGDSAEWDYNWDVDDTTKAKYTIVPAVDYIVEVRLYLKSRRDAWRETGTALKDFGMPWEQIIATIGAKPPCYSAYGVVRYAEQKDDDPQKTKTPRTAAQKWADMDMKYPRAERTKKRGRSAIINAVCPVTTDQRRRLANKTLKAAAQPGIYIDGHGRVGPDVGKQLTHEQRADRLGRDEGDSLIVEKQRSDSPAPASAPGTPIAPQTPVDDGEIAAKNLAHDEYQDAVLDPVTGEWIPIDEEPETQAAPEEPASQADPEPPPQQWSEAVTALKAKLDARAQQYAEQGRECSEKQGKFIFVLIQNDLARKDEAARKLLTKALTGFDHFPDIPACYLLALKDEFIKPREGADHRSNADPEAIQMAATIIAEARKMAGQQSML